MIDLQKYRGNFLECADQEFNFTGERQTFLGIDGLDLQVAAHVAIFPCALGEPASVSIDADDLSDFTVIAKSGIISIEQKDTGGNVTIGYGGNRTVTVSGGNVSMIGNRVFVDGKEVSEESAPIKRQTRIRVALPGGSSLDAILAGSSVLASKVAFSKLDISGEATVGLAAKMAKLKLSGLGDSYIVVQGGLLDLSVSGQGRIIAKGVFEDVDASVSGMGSIETRGDCEGTYSAQISGMGRIKHSGKVQGRIKKNISGMGSISGL